MTDSETFAILAQDTVRPFVARIIKILNKAGRLRGIALAQAAAMHLHTIPPDQRATVRTAMNGMIDSYVEMLDLRAAASRDGKVE